MAGIAKIRRYSKDDDYLHKVIAKEEDASLFEEHEKNGHLQLHYHTECILQDLQVIMYFLKSLHLDHEDEMIKDEINNMANYIKKSFINKIDLNGIVAKKLRIIIVMIDEITGNYIMNEQFSITDVIGRIYKIVKYCCGLYEKYQSNNTQH